MNWKLKAHALALLSRLPLGQQAYHLLQRVVGTNRLDVDLYLHRTFELVDLIHDAGGSVEDAEVVEIGTGWRPFLPFVFSLLGARSVRTLDVNPWLSLEYARETWQSLEPRLAELAERGNVRLSDVQRRYARVNAEVESLVELLTPLNIQYLYPGDARQTGLADNSIDLIVSSNVLEHIPAEILLAIHQESRRILHPEGLAVHRFNPQDHYSTVDGRVTHVNFLQFSEQEWHWYGGSGLAYHNRLRAPQQRQLFLEAGLDLDIVRERIDSRSLQLIQQNAIKVHPDFHQFSPEELAVDYMWVVARQPSRLPEDASARATSAPLPHLQPSGA